MISNENDALIVRSVIDLGHNLGLTIVAEGVETTAICDQLTEMGCDIGQGYHFARRGAAETIDNWHANHTTAPHPPSTATPLAHTHEIHTRPPAHAATTQPSRV